MLGTAMASLSSQPSLPFGQSPEPSRRGERLMSVQELADYLDVPVKTIYAWRYHREGPRGFKIGRHVRFRWHDVDAWLADRIEAKG
jgi:excisionase family DNA binding protein